VGRGGGLLPLRGRRAARGGGSVGEDLEVGRDLRQLVESLWEERVRVLERTAETVGFYAEMSRKVGRVTTVMLPPGLDMLAVQDFGF